jgi:exopolyphosphatase / guanosine-5'-triphosphate,3'-diphosphate pyrophosphatase
MNLMLQTENKIAVIDLGTNTFQLGIAKIANGKFEFLYEKSLATKLGKGGISKGIISEEAIERALSALEVFSETAKNFEIAPKNIWAFGTSAIRNAGNGQQFCQIVKGKLGIEISIIDGNKEAEMISDGVRYAVDFTDAPYLIMDIGGGSVEFIIANNVHIFWKQSFEIGGQRLMDLYFKNDPISPSEVKKLQNHLEESLIPLWNAMHQYSPKTLVGSAGSFETLVDIFNASLNTLLPIDSGISSVLPVESFYDSYFKFLEMDRATRMEIPGMIDLRVDMIVVASILIDYILKSFKIENILVSNYALKEGALAKIAKNEPLQLI